MGRRTRSEHVSPFANPAHKGFTRSELEAAWTRIGGTSDRRAPIQAECTQGEIGVAMAAIEYFIGGPITVGVIGYVRGDGRCWMTIESPGLRDEDGGAHV